MRMCWAGPRSIKDSKLSLSSIKACLLRPTLCAACQGVFASRKGAGHLPQQSHHSQWLHSHILGHHKPGSSGHPHDHALTYHQVCVEVS